jgi:hypothetical protein
MLMTPSVRKFALATHVTTSLGWFGAVSAFLSLAVAGVASTNAQLVRSAYVAMELVTWAVIVPFSIATLLSGVVQSLGTTWGLFRYRWIVAKLTLTVVATIILLVHTQPIGRVAAIASQGLLSTADLHPLRMQLIADAGATMMALLVATALSIYKPWGLTGYGRRAELADHVGSNRTKTVDTTWTTLWVVGLIIALALFAALHLSGGGFHHH